MSACQLYGARNGGRKMSGAPTPRSVSISSTTFVAAHFAPLAMRSLPSTALRAGASARDDSHGLSHLIDEAHDVREHAVGREGGEIDALDDRRARYRAERPGEAHGVVVAVDLGDALQHKARELGLDAGQHGVEAGLAVAHHHRIAVAHVGGAGRSQRRLAPGRVSLVPARDVAFNDGFDVGHGNSPSDGTPEGERDSGTWAIS